MRYYVPNASTLKKLLRYFYCQSKPYVHNTRNSNVLLSNNKRQEICQKILSQVHHSMEVLWADSSSTWEVCLTASKESVVVPRINDWFKKNIALIISSQSFKIQPHILILLCGGWRTQSYFTTNEFSTIRGFSRTNLCQSYSYNYQSYNFILVVTIFISRRAKNLQKVLVVEKTAQS